MKTSELDTLWTKIVAYADVATASGRFQRSLSAFGGRSTNWSIIEQLSQPVWKTNSAVVLPKRSLRCNRSPG
jgi:hypothetical protein